MAPEQAAGKKNLDHRVDIYAAGALLYMMLTGKRPFDGNSYNELIVKITSKPFTPPRKVNPDIPESIERVILTAMARDPMKRYQSARLMRSALNEAGKQTFSIEVQNDDEEPVVLTVSLSSLPEHAPVPRATIVDAKKKEGDAPILKERRDRRPSSRCILGFTAMGIGISGLALGVAFNVKGAKDHDSAMEIYSPWAWIKKPLNG